MTNLSPEFCFKIKEARRAAKISQGELASELGCKQSAISMFEQGDGTKLNDKAIAKLAEKFGIALPAPSAEAVPAPAPVPVRGAATQGFCPNPSCPTNRPYEVDGRSFRLPDRRAADPAGGRFCAMCGETLERRCPGCGAPVHAGAFCSFCGDHYVSG